MPAAITLRNMLYVALITVLMLAFGDAISTQMTVVAQAGFFPMLVNTMQGLHAAGEILLDRRRILNASWFETFRFVRLPYACLSSSPPRKSRLPVQSLLPSVPNG